MRLFEITEPELRRKRYRGEFKRPDNIRGEEEGVSGFYSQIKHDKREKDKITKRSKTTMAAEVDPFWKFLAHIKENELMNNPFFPEFYVMTEIVDQSDKAMRKVKMERLYPLTSLEPKDIVDMFDQLFGMVPPSVRSDFEAIQKRDVTRFRGEKPIKTFLLIFVKYVEGAIRGHVTPVDNNFNIAIGHLRDMKRKFNALWDVKASNVMVRNPQSQPQLVFTDVLG